jgi:superoxide reductase
MTEKFEMYRCEICGNFVQVLLEGDGELTCCGQAMTHLEPKGADAEMLGEKHVPVFEDLGDGRGEIKIGSIPHPMTPEHQIMFIEAISKDKKCFKLKYLEPGDDPKMEIPHCFDKIGCAKEYCNLHGLWKGKKE